MATIVNRGNNKSRSVVYYYEDKDTNQVKQKWETYPSYEEAKKRKVEIESAQAQGTFVVPDNQTVSEFLDLFSTLYGSVKWGINTYSAHISLMGNYINPLIGNKPIQSIKPLDIELFYRELRKTKPVIVNNRKPKTEFLPPATINRIHILLKCAFSKAVDWQIIGKNHFLYASVPEYKSQQREVWTMDTIKKALDCCRDPKLYLAINISFACSARIGEILGCTWDNVYISDEDIACDNAHIVFNKQLQRANKKDMEEIEKKSRVLFEFPPVLKKENKTVLVLTKPKTDFSERTVWVPRTLAFILQDWKKSQDKMKDCLGCDYKDYNLVVALEDGRPCDTKVIEKAFQRLIKENNLPPVVFHSLRHSSATYKLKLNNGDLKATQGDTGHAQTSTLTEIYAHVLDEDRKMNAQKFERAFYAKPDLREIKVEQSRTDDEVLNDLIAEIKSKPDLHNMLIKLLAN